MALLAAMRETKRAGAFDSREGCCSGSAADFASCAGTRATLATRLRLDATFAPFASQKLRESGLARELL
jgi:hypothetical protein